jgi:hypothetical protein
MLWLKRLLIAVAAVILLAILATAVGYRQMHGVPDFYAHRNLNAREMEAAAETGLNKLINVQNWAAEHHAQESARLHAAAAANPATAPAAAAATKPAANTTTVEFSEDELNAFFQKWVSKEGWADKFGKYVADPAIFLQDGRVILAGTVKEMNALASAHFEPRLDAAGNLDLRLVKVLGGNLPLPKAVWSAQRDKLAQAVAQHLPEWRKDAAISPSGTANLDAVSAGLSETLLNVLQDKPSEPVIFLPVMNSGAVPARLTAVSIADKTLSLTVAPMTPAERQAFLARLKTPDGPTASAR